MSIVGKLTGAMVNAGKNAIFSAEKHSPEILVGGGVVLGVGACFGACKATLRAEELLDEMKADLDTIKEARERIDEETYTKEDHTKDLMIAYGRGGMRFLKLYWKPVVMGAASIACILGGFGILKGRHMKLIAAYGGLKQSYDALYSRIGKEFSPEAAQRFAGGVYKTEAEINEIDKDGNVKTKKKKVDMVREDELGPYEFIFGPDCPAWCDCDDYNLSYLQAQEDNANHLLITKRDRILTASEMFTEMRMDHIPKDFYVVGWKLPRGYFRDHTEKYIQWDIREIYKDYKDGYGPVKAYIVNLNCDGYVWDKIPS